MTKCSQISAIIIARDESANLDECLDSLAWVDETIVVVDAASTDATESIARARADRVVVRPFDGFAAQRNAGRALGRGDWLLAIDADERVTGELATEIRAMIRRSDHNVAGYQINIRSVIFGRPFVASGTQLDWPLRLFRREQGEWIGDVHETVALNGSVGRLQHVIDHRTHENLSVFLAKLDRYTTLEARQLHDQGRRPRLFDLTLRPLWTFLRIYLARGGFRDGVEGFLFSALSGVSVLIRNAKLRERTKAKPTDKLATTRCLMEVPA